MPTRTLASLERDSYSSSKRMMRLCIMPGPRRPDSWMRRFSGVGVSSKSILHLSNWKYVTGNSCCLIISSHHNIFSFLGYSLHTLLMVAKMYCMISARDQTKKERKIYERQA